MSDDFDDLRSSLKRAADDYRPALDPAALEEAGRRYQRRRNAVVGLAGAGVLVVVAALIVPSLLSSPAVVPAIPAPAATSGAATSPATPTPTPTPMSTQEDQKYPPIASAMAIVGWKTFTSKEYPITFKYPSDWTVDTGGGILDGCMSINCVLTVTPPRTMKAAAIELIRNGFDPEDSTGGDLGKRSKVEILGALPDVVAWTADAKASPLQAVVARSPEAGAADNYSLTPSDLSVRMALGEPSNWPEHPERVFLFATNTGNIGGGYDKAGRDTVIAILASSRPNADFNPTQPTDDGSGKKVMKVFATMPDPVFGKVRPDSTWKTVTSSTGKLSARYPSSWKIISHSWGVIELRAPSGYVIDLVTNTGNTSCDFGAEPISKRIGVTTLDPIGKSGTGPVEIRFENGGELPVWVGLAQRSVKDNCYVGHLNYGGTKDAYLGSQDNGGNPTAKELDEIVAILGSATRLH